MPPKKPVPQPAAVYRPRWQRERQRQRFILLFGAIAISLVLGLVAFGYFYYIIAPRWQPVLTVNGVSFNAAYLAKSLRLLSGAQSPFDPATLARITLDEIQRSEIVRQQAPGLGLSVTPEEIEETLRQGLAPGEEEKNFPQIYSRRLKETGFSDAEYRRLVENDLLRQKLRDYFQAQLPTEVEQVHLFAIQVATEEQARGISQRLEQGEDFAALAQELSQDEASKENGGDMGWLPRGIRPELTEAAFALEPGQISQPVAAAGGYYVLKGGEKEVRPLETGHREWLGVKEYQRWLQEQEESSQIERNLAPRLLRWALAQAGLR